MRVLFKPSFIKDFKKLPYEIQREVRSICVDIFPKLRELRRFRRHSLKLLRGFKGYYRIRIGDYRIGFRKSKNDTIEFMRVKHRKDIYKNFP